MSEISYLFHKINSENTVKEINQKFTICYLSKFFIVSFMVDLPPLWVLTISKMKNSF